MTRSVRGLLEHPLLGVDPRYTTAAVGLTALLVGGVVVDAVLARGPVTGLPTVVAVPLEGGIAALVVVLVLSNTLFPVGYGLVNGGPVVAAGLSLVPQLTVVAVTRQWVLTGDLLVALLGAALGATVAVGRLSYRARTESAPPAGLVDGLFLATGLTVVATAGATRLAANPPPAFDPRLAVAGAVVVVTACVAAWVAAATPWR